MEAKVEQTPATNKNPVLSVDKNGCVLSSNEAGNLLLNEWGVRVGEKLPSHIGNIVQRVISYNSPEKMEVKVGNRVYLVIFSPLPEQECVNISGFDISEQKEIEEHLLEVYEQIQTQSEELSVSKRDLKVQSDELNEANTLLQDSVIGFRTLAENSPDLIARFDRQNHCLYANPAALRFCDTPLSAEFYDWSVHEFIDKINSKVEINPEMMKLSEKLRKNAFTTGKSEAMVFHYTSSKGKKYWFDTKVIPEFANNVVVSVLIISSDITDLKEAEATLRSSNLYNRSLIEASLDPLVIIGNDGNVTDVNKATEQATGYSRNDLIGTYFTQYLTEPDHAISAFIHVCTHGELRDCALEIKRRDGHITPVLCNASVYRDENGKVIGVFVAARDVTERKKAEKALKKAHDSLEERVKERTEELEKAYISLKESERSLAEAQEMAHIGNWERNFAINKLHWSNEMYRIFGLKPQEFEVNYGLFLKYVHPDYRDYVDNAFKEALNGKLFDTNFRIIPAHGDERIVHVKGEIVFDDNNNPVRIRGTTQDITEHKKAEEKLRESEEKYRNIVETANEGIALISSEGIITYINQKMADMLGYAIEEIVDRTIWEFVEEEKSVVTTLFEKIRRGNNDSFEIKLIRKDGSTLWIFVSSKPLFDKDGRFIGALNLHTDITKRKEAEEALANIEIARQKEIHHRIKNNLQVISSLLDLQADMFNNREYIKCSEVLEAFKESQNRVISMALIHEELHKGEGLDMLNFSSYIKELADGLLLTYTLGDEAINLNMDLDHNIFFDMEIAIPLGIIINEFISNSLKHAFSGRDKGEIRIKLHREECKSSNFTLSVSDNGIGIPEDLDIENLESLGLQLVTTLVEQLDGELELKRENGTEFVIRFTVRGSNDQELVPRKLNYGT